MRVARGAGRARASAPRASRSAPSTASTSATGVCSGRARHGAHADRRHLRPPPARRVRQPRGAAGDAGAAARADRRAGRGGGARRRASTSRSRARARGVRRALPARDRRAASSSPARTSASAAAAPATSRCSSELGFETCAVAGRRRVVDARSASWCGPARCARRRPCSAAPSRSRATVVAGDARGGTLGFPTANIAMRADLAVPRTASTPARRARGHRAAVSVGLNPHYGGQELRLEAFLLDFAGDLYGRRLVVELWRRLRDEQAFESEAALVEQIAHDVERTARQAVQADLTRTFQSVLGPTSDGGPSPRRWHESVESMTHHRRLKMRTKHILFLHRGRSGARRWAAPALAQHANDDGARLDGARGAATQPVDADESGIEDEAETRRRVPGPRRREPASRTRPRLGDESGVEDDEEYGDESGPRTRSRAASRRTWSRRRDGEEPAVEDELRIRRRERRRGRGRGRRRGRDRGRARHG